MDAILKAQPTIADEARFWSKCDKTQACWNWTMGKSSDGYGKFTLRRGKKTFTLRAHRLAFYFANKKINENLLICHSCDNISCSNPSHLFEGTVKENWSDAQNKGRIVISKGENLSDLTSQQVLSIRERVGNGERQIKVAKELGVGKNAIWHIVKRTTWKHI